MRERFSDAELMEQVRDREDPEAFRLLTSRWRPRLTAYFRALSGDLDEADDATQEVLLRLWSRRAQYRATGRFEAYVMTLAKHHWLNLRRSLRRWEAEQLTAVGADGDPAAEVLARAARESLVRAVTGLSEAHRSVVRLVVDDGLSQEQAAGRLAIPVGTVKSRLHAARRRLRTLLEEDDDA